MKEGFKVILVRKNINYGSYYFWEHADLGRQLPNESQ